MVSPYSFWIFDLKIGNSVSHFPINAKPHTHAIRSKEFRYLWTLCSFVYIFDRFSDLNIQTHIWKYGECLWCGVTGREWPVRYFKHAKKELCDEHRSEANRSKKEITRTFSIFSNTSFHKMYDAIARAIFPSRIIMGRSNYANTKFKLCTLFTSITLIHNNLFKLFLKSGIYCVVPIIKPFGFQCIPCLLRWLQHSKTTTQWRSSTASRCFIEKKGQTNRKTVPYEQQWKSFWLNYSLISCMPNVVASKQQMNIKSRRFLSTASSIFLSIVFFYHFFCSLA